MKLGTYLRPEGIEAVFAVLADGDLLDLAIACEGRVDDASEAFASMTTLIERWDDVRALAERLVDAAPGRAVRRREEAHLLAPLPRPAQMRDFLSFETHFRQARAAITRLWAQPGAPSFSPDDPLPDLFYRQPVYYKANRFAVCGPDTDVVWPSYSQVMDYELELAAVIGRRGRDVPTERAAEHIFGFTIFNDFSARDAQQLEMPGSLGPAKGKDFDNANALGPWIVTRDELADPYGLTMQARINGELVSQGSSADMHWSFEQMIAHVSQAETLHPGEVFGSGTVGGGCGLELGRFLADGDVVELEVSGIGVLRNRVRSGRTA
ncbi:fumarylacetoacetate hydrolase family protein [Phenylobacterium sp.]|uniref:fumarylacetoacetate hydrolase family protein n=1 Tax=Phenylobacterium sp. TaxID=1871053 RepID=UPI0035B45681